MNFLLLCGSYKQTSSYSSNVLMVLFADVTAQCSISSLWAKVATLAGGFHFLNSSRRKSETFTIIRSFFR
jgi:hypothetical protein